MSEPKWYVVAEHWKSRSKHAIEGDRPWIYGNPYATLEAAEARIRNLKRSPAFRSTSLFVMEVKPVG